MGLDVYLYKFEDYEGERKAVQEADEQTGAIWDEMAKGRKYEDIPEEEKDEYHKKSKELKIALGLTGEWNDHFSTTEQIELPSSLYPDHYFKIGYFRSSYNDGGTNHVLKNILGKDLYSIFPEVRNNEEYDYAFIPDWQAALHRTDEMIKDFKTHIAKAGNFWVTKLTHMSWRNSANSEKEALEVFLKQYEKYKVNVNQGFGSYTCIDGEFHMADPLEVVGIIPGKEKERSFGSDGNCLYLITRPKSGEGYTWYLNALEIVKETIEYVLSQQNVEKYRLSWSD